MPARSIFAFISSLVVACCMLPAISNAQADTATTKAPKKPKVKASQHQLRIGIDLVKPALNFFNDNTKNYEITADYYFKNEIYFVADVGFGTADVPYEDLSYKSTSQFIRVGVDKSMLQRLLPGDWDVVTVGARYGLGFVKRGDATYVINDPLWGKYFGTVAAKNFTAHWAEFNAGIRVEPVKHIFVGWNIRARFMLNAKAFEELAPAYISGFGKGDKSTAFDFNFYLNFALRWSNKTKPPPVPS